MDHNQVEQLTAAADDIFALILELERMRKLGLDTTDQEARIATQSHDIETGVRQLEEVLRANEESGKFTTAELKEQENTFLSLVEKLERVQESSEQKKTTARDLLFQYQNKSSSSATPSSTRTPATVVDIMDAVGNRPGEVDMDAAQMLQLQERTFEDQDRNLDALGQSVRRQRELGLTMNQELDYHIQLLDETEQAADRTGHHLQFAHRSLDNFQRQARKARK
ncbi:hypothetical protein IWQ62_002284 [Dispira parvispora]|uniref:t-SNARE coiled-coil homology domain-containing protein n=1 Tax=Dispira parvispora TaxID=1520584 RepID=A0A9W8E7B1_9FUNG|nr:hypothetical protein IWQ62_002284 [Dispira parvispora]